MLRQCIRCDAPSLSLADYDFIMQCHNDRPRFKVLNELKEKYSISQKRIYQIGRGEEKNKVAWDQLIFSRKLEKINLDCQSRLSIYLALIDLSGEGGDSKRENLDNKSILSSSDLSREGIENLASKLIPPSSNLSQKGRDLNAFYEKEAICDKKNIAKYLNILAK